MQLVAHKLLPPNTLPSLSDDKARRYVYRLGIRCCPSMDLIATYPILLRHPSSKSTGSQKHDAQSDSDDDEAIEKNNTGAVEAQYYMNEEENGINIDVWRFNGQRVFTVLIENEDDKQITIKGLEWRHDGQILAVLSSDNMTYLVNSFSGKVVHRFSSLPTHPRPPSPVSPRARREKSKSAFTATRSRPTLLSYTTHFFNARATLSLLHTAHKENSVVLDDLLGLKTNVSALLQSPADLPRELANIDVESFLPRLSCLPPIGFGTEDVFSTRNSIDTIFHSSRKNIQSGNVDVLVTGHHDGIASIRIFDSFEIGSVDLSAATDAQKPLHIGKLIRAAACPFTNEVVVVAEDVNKRRWHMFGLDLKFIAHGSSALPVLVIKATQLQNLLRYLTQIQTQLTREVKAAFDLPTRYLRNVNEDLEKQDGQGSSFNTAAYHAIVTGEVSGAFKEWLGDQVGDRGVKRWEKSVGDCLDLARRLVSEAWCPAVERAGVVVSRLHGLAGWMAQMGGEQKGFGMDRALVENLRDTIDVIGICSEECLREITKEMTGFTSFIKWLKWEVEASSLEDTSEKLDEMREGSDHTEVTKVLEYIDKPLQDSILKSYFGGTAGATDVDHEETNFYAKFKEQRARREKNKRDSTSHIPTLGQLLERLRVQCDGLFAQIAQNLQQSIMTRYIVELDPRMTTETMDIRVVMESGTAAALGRIRAHVIARTEDETNVIHQVTEVGGATQVRAGSSSIHVQQPPDTEKVLDVRFVDDFSFMILVKAAENIKIYSHPVDGLDRGIDLWELRHCFEQGVMESGMRPAYLEVNGRKNRRVVEVADESGKGYAVLDLDSSDSKDGEHERTGEDEVMTG